MVTLQIWIFFAMQWSTAQSLRSYGLISWAVWSLYCTLGSTIQRQNSYFYSLTYWSINLTYWSINLTYWSINTAFTWPLVIKLPYSTYWSKNFHLRPFGQKTFTFDLLVKKLPPQSDVLTILWWRFGRFAFFGNICTNFWQLNLWFLLIYIELSSQLSAWNNSNIWFCRYAPK